MRKYDWRIGMPDIKWIPECASNRQLFNTLCETAGISAKIGRMGILCAAWREHNTDDLVVADLKEFAVFSAPEIEMIVSCEASP